MHVPILRKLNNETMKKYIGVFVLLTFAFITSGQGDDQNTNLGAYEASENLRSLGSAGAGAVTTFDNRYKGVKGSVYMFQDWFPGELFLKEKKRVHFPNLNYDVFDNYVVYKEEIGGTILEVNKKLIDFFMIYGLDSMKFVPVKHPKSGKMSFVEILYSGNTKLYRIYEKEFLKANYEGGYSADRKYDEFVDKISIYMSLSGQEEMIKLKTSKSMSKQFPDHNSEMKKYIGNYSAKELKGKYSLVEIMKYYDSL